MKKNVTIEKLLDIAKQSRWDVAPSVFDDFSTGYTLTGLSPYGLELSVELPARDTNGNKSPEVLVKELRKFYETYNPEQEALLWIGPDAKGRCGAPARLTDVIKDMNACKRKLQRLLNAWENVAEPKQNNGNNHFTMYLTIRIDAEYNPQKTSAKDALDTAVSKVISDARSHMHTIECGVRITGITDCSEPAKTTE